MLYRLAALALGLSAGAFGSPAGPTQIDFTLKAAYTTSAGVYRPDGTLIRTLWRGVAYPAGNHRKTWDGQDDTGQMAADGDYQVRLLYHNVRYEWEGVLGNTSQATTGPTVHRAGGLPTAFATAPLANGVTRLYYTAGYNEQQSPFHRCDIDPANPGTQQVASDMQEVSNPAPTPYALRPDYRVAMIYAACDGKTVYWANTDSKVNNVRFVIASQVSDDQIVHFAAGQDVYLGDDGGGTPSRVYDAPGKPVTSDYNDAGHWPSCLDVNDRRVDTTGLDVQRSGPCLFVAHGAINTIDVLNKTTGKLLGTRNLADFGLRAPGGLAVLGNDLWVICQAKAGPVVRRLIVSPADGALFDSGVDLSDATLSQPLAIAACTARSALLVADGGDQQRLKAFNRDGGLLWAFGKVGGYRVSPDVSRDKFDFGGTFVRDRFGYFTCLGCQADGSFWVEDSGTYRSRHYTWPRAGSAGPRYLSDIGYIPACYSVGCDPNDTKRVFCDFLEYAVPSYTRPLSSYRLAGPVRDWRYVDGRGDLATNYTSYTGAGLQTPVTVSRSGESHTYTVLNDAVRGMDERDRERSELFELAGRPDGSGGMRDTGIRFHRGDGELATLLYADGSLRWATLAHGRQVYWSRRIEGFDGQGNPRLGGRVELGSVPQVEPPAGSEQATRLPSSASGMLVIYCKERQPGMHLGGLSLAEAVSGKAQAWKWRAAPSGDLAAGVGNYDVGGGVEYGGNNALVAGRNIVCGYQGEFWHGGEANQWLHYYDDGLFVGQFGTYSRQAANGAGSTYYAAAGFAGNAFSNALVTPPTGGVYLWHNDESNHGGIHRWHLVNAEGLAEMAGTGRMGGVIALRP